MTIHKEGRKIVRHAAIVFVVLALAVYFLYPAGHWGQYVSFLFIVLLYGWTLWFFRSPARTLTGDPGALISPADGHVVIVEPIDEKEVFGRPMQQVSIFMSPLDVHLNRCPADARVVSYNYFPGKHLVALYPKSSRLNEHNTIVFETGGGIRFVVRQIAGFIARRIVCYCREGKVVRQGEELGFIKFGSRVDLMLPTDSEILVKVGDRVRGGVTPVARFARSSK